MSKPLVMMNTLFIGAVLALTLSLQSLPVYARTQQFQASWEASRWVVETGFNRCSMTHEIPRFGRARFEQVSGQRLQFSLYADQPPVADSAAQVYSQAPSWKHPMSSLRLGKFDFVQGKNPLRVPRTQALRIYSELEQGMQPVFSFPDWGDQRDQVEVSLSPVRFREVLPDFLACTAGLLYLDFEPTAEKTVYFSTNSDRLSRAARRGLESVARDYRKNKDVRIILAGHADERAESDYNMNLSQRRTRMVDRYLRSRGVSPKVIELRYFGESQPAVQKNTKQAWAKNRRVTVWFADKSQ